MSHRKIAGTSVSILRTELWTAAAAAAAMHLLTAVEADSYVLTIPTGTRYQSDFENKVRFHIIIKYKSSLFLRTEVLYFHANPFTSLHSCLSCLVLFLHRSLI